MHPAFIPIVIRPEAFMLDTAATLAGLGGVTSILCESDFFGYNSAVDRATTGGEPAYNYSVHLIRDHVRGGYRLFYGGRWKSATGDGDHVLEVTSPFGRPGTWTVSTGPEFPQGGEEGYEGAWFSGNCIEPEVVKVSGIYYMYTQVQVPEGTPLDVPGVVAGYGGADRIQLHTSTDGETWTRWSRQTGVVVNIDDPAIGALHHQEVIHVPWDPDGRPFWMYLHRGVGEQDRVWRLRSAQPTRFDWQLRESTWLPELGNQIGYAQEAPGGPLFVRISFFVQGDGRMTPCLHFSRDGLAWTDGDAGRVNLEGSDNAADFRNCFFLGMSTRDGTGRLETLGNNQFDLLYGATTGSGPASPEIYTTRIGVGACRFTLNPALPALEGRLMLCDGLPPALVIGSRRLQFGTLAVGLRLARRLLQVTSAFYHTVPYGASLPQGARCIVAPGQPGCFVLDDGRKWPVSCIEVVQDAGSTLEAVAQTEYDRFPTGPALRCI
ncbi:MAG TPA: hypothetical protein VF771_18290 [Longimicrobiaceae bacterium]